MTQQNQGLQKVGDIKAVLSTATGPEDLISLPQVKKAFVAIRMRANGVSAIEADAMHEMEKIRFVKALADNNQLAACDPFSLYNAWVDLGLSGGTLNEGECYIIPRGGKAMFQPGWKHRLKMIQDLKNVIFAHEPQIVMSDDDFVFRRTPTGIEVDRHDSPKEHDADAYITHVYMGIECDHGTVVYMMEAEEVINIRDQRSDSYKYWKSKASKGEYAKPTMWTTDEKEAYKKTMVHRAYKKIPKTKDNVPQKNQILDSKLGNEETVDEGLDNLYNNMQSGEETPFTPHEDVKETPPQQQENIFAKKYEAVADIEAILNECTTMGDMVALFSNNTELIEGNADLKGKFTAEGDRFRAEANAAKENPEAAVQGSAETDGAAVNTDLSTEAERKTF